MSTHREVGKPPPQRRDGWRKLHLEVDWLRPNHHTTKGWRPAKGKGGCKALLGDRTRLAGPQASADKKIYISPQEAAERAKQLSAETLE